MILSAVAGFFGLGKAVMTTNRVEVTKTEREKAVLIATEIINYSASLRGAASRLVPGGCDITEISFEKFPFDGTDAAYANPGSPDDYFCHVFHPNGAGVSARLPNEEWLDDTHAAEPYYGEMPILNVCVTGYGVDPATSCGIDGETTSDVVLFIPYLRKHICEELAKQLHPKDGILVDTNDAFDVGNEFFGTFNNSSSIDESGNSNRIMPLSGCIVGDGSGSNLEADEYAFYTALISQ